MWIDTTDTDVRLMDDLEGDHGHYRTATLATHHAPSDSLQDSEYAAVKAALTEWHREDGLEPARWVRTPDTDERRGFWYKDTPDNEWSQTRAVAVIDMHRELGIRDPALQTPIARFRDRVLPERVVTAIHERQTQQQQDAARFATQRMQQIRRDLPPIPPRGLGM